MSNAYPNVSSSAQILGTAVDPTGSQLLDNQTVPAALDRSNALLVSEVHGVFFQGTKRGSAFAAQANGATGRTILAPGGTTSGFMFYNPAGSGVDMEILQILAAPLTATDVVGVIGLEYGAPPTTVANAAASSPMYVGGKARAAQCKASYGSTIVAMTFLQWLPLAINTTGGLSYGGSVLYLPNGSLVIGQGGAVNIVSSTSQSTNLWAQHVIWAEYPA